MLSFVRLLILMYAICDILGRFAWLPSFSSRPADMQSDAISLFVSMIMSEELAVKMIVADATPLVVPTFSPIRHDDSRSRSIHFLQRYRVYKVVFTLLALFLCVN